MAANPPTLPTPTENTDIDIILNRLVSSVVGLKLAGAEDYKQFVPTAKAAIEQKLTDARIDELKLCLGDKNVMPLDFSDIKNRIAALQASKEGK